MDANHLDVESPSRTIECRRFVANGGTTNKQSALRLTGFTKE